MDNANFTYKVSRSDTSGTFADVNDIFFENHRIISPDESTETREYLANIVRRLATLPDFKDKDLSRFRFLVSDQDSINAFVFCKEPARYGNEYGSKFDHTRPIVVVNKGLIESARSEDELAFVLFHEVGHPYFAEVSSVKYGHAIEESAADIKAVEWLIASGYNWKAAVDLFQRFVSNEEEKQKDNLGRILAQHSSPEDRIKYITTYVGNLSFRGHTVSSGESPSLVPSEVLDNCKQIKHASFFDALQSHDQFDSLSISEKLDFLDQFLPLDIPHQKRRADWLTLLRGLVRDEFEALPEEEKLQGISHINSIIKNTFAEFCSSDFRRDAYRVAHNFLTGESLEPEQVGSDASNILIPLGKYWEINEAFRGFLQAKDISEVRKFSGDERNAISQATKIHNLERENFETFIPLVKFSTFQREPQNPQALPWNPYIQWAREIKDTEEAIAHTLFDMGITNDPRIWDLFSLKSLERLLNSYTQLPALGKLPADLAEPYGIPVSSKENSIHTHIALRRLKESPAVRVEEIGNSNKFDAYVEMNEPFFYAPSHKDNPLREAFSQEQIESDHFKIAQGIVDQFDAILERNQEPSARVTSSSDIRRFLERKAAFFNDGEHGYPMDSPFVQFIVQNPHRIFTSSERFHLLANVLSAGTQDLKWWREVAGYEAPQNMQQLMGLFEFPCELAIHNPLMRSNISLTDFGKTKIRSLQLQEINDFLESERFSPSRDIKFLPNLMRTFSELNIPLLKGFSESQPENQAEVQRLRRNLKKAFFPDSKNLNPLLLEKEASFPVLCYNFLNGAALFPNIEARASLGKEVINFFENSRDSVFRSGEIESFFFINEVCDYHLEEKLVQMWLETIEKKMEKDDGSDEYHNEIMRTLRGVKKGEALDDRVLKWLGKGKYSLTFPSEVYYKMVDRLANRVEAQPRLAFAMRDSLIPGKMEMVESGLKFKAIQEFLQDLAKHPTEHDAFFEFLITPLSNESIEKFETQTKKEEAGKNESDREKPKDLFEALLGATESNALSEEEKKSSRHIALEDVHVYFWNQSMENRTLFMDRLMIPSIELANGAQQAYERAMAKVLRILFPDEAADSLESKHNRWGRVVLENFVQNSPDEEKGLILAAAVVAAEKTQKAANIIDRLGAFLEAYGSAGIKTKQAGHSLYPVELDSWRESKTMADPPTRWEWCELIYKKVPRAERKKIRWVGPMCGTASFWLNGDVTYQDKEEVVLGILRERAHQRAKAGFTRFEKCLLSAAAQEKDFQSIKDMGIEIIRQASEMVDVETNVPLAARQASFAAEMYNGWTIATGDHEFISNAAAWKMFASESRIVNKVKGRHFNDLPENTDAEKSYKRDLAKAYLTLEFSHILSGGHFDCDRHGAQLRVKGKHVGVFDHGGMIMDKPSDEEKAQLGQVLMQGFMAMQTGGNLNDVMIDQIRQIQQTTGKRPDYLMKVQKGLLALNDFMSCVSREDFVDILKAVVHSGKVDPLILPTAICDLMKGMGKSSIQFTHTPYRQTEHPQDYTKVKNGRPQNGNGVAKKPFGGNGGHRLAQAFRPQASVISPDLVLNQHRSTQVRYSEAGRMG